MAAPVVITLFMANILLEFSAYNAANECFYSWLAFKNFIPDYFITIFPLYIPFLKIYLTMFEALNQFLNIIIR